MGGLALALLTALLLWLSGDCLAAATRAAGVFVTGVMPALFPMLVLAGLPAKGEGAVSAVGFAFAAGSPAGGKRLAGLAAQRVGRSPARSLAPLFVTAGVMSPLFFVGSLSAWTGNPTMAWLMLGIHWVSALAAGGLALGLERLGRQRASPLACPDPVTAMHPSIRQQGEAGGPSLLRALPEAVAAAMRALLAVCGAMMLFAVAAALLRGALAALWPAWTSRNGRALAFVHALLEIGGGAHGLVTAFSGQMGSPSGQALYPLLCAACGFGGFSIWLQNLAYTGQNIRPGALLLFRAVHGAVSYGLCWAAMGLWPALAA